MRKVQIKYYSEPNLLKGLDVLMLLPFQIFPWKDFICKEHTNHIEVIVLFFVVVLNVYYKTGVNFTDISNAKK